MEEIKAAAWNPNDKERQATTYASIVVSFLSEVIHKLSTGSNYEYIKLQLRSSIYHYTKLCDIILPGDPPNLSIQQGAVWVKASEFKYITGAAYHAKDNLSKGAGKFDSSGIFIWGDGSLTLPHNQGDLLILDESGSAAAGREEDAAFAEWLDKQRNENTDSYSDMKIWGKETAFKLMYELFKQQKEKQ